MSSTHKKEEKAICEVCGEPMPEGEEMFNFHGYSSNCPKPPLPIKAEGWEERFDDQFRIPEASALKAFIRSEISLALKEERTRIAGMVREMRKDTPTEFDTGSEFSTPRIIRANGYNQALSDITARLESEGSLEDKG